MSLTLNFFNIYIHCLNDRMYVWQVSSGDVGSSKTDELLKQMQEEIQVLRKENSTLKVGFTHS